jgi:hypothetical protein
LFSLTIIGFLFLPFQAMSQDDREAQSTNEPNKLSEPKLQTDDKKSTNQIQPEKENTQQPSTNQAANAGVSTPTVETQRGCRLQIKGLATANKSSPIKIKGQDGTMISAKFIAMSKGIVVASVSGDDCKKKLKGLVAETAPDPELQPVQLAIIHEPQSSGWHRTKNAGSWTIGAGAGMRMQVPLIRLEIGSSYSNIAFLAAWETGAMKNTILDSQVLSSIFEMQFYNSNSLYFSTGFAADTVVGKFQPIKSVDGVLKQTDEYLATYTSTSSKIHSGIGNRWQWGRLSVGIEWIGFRGALLRNDEIKLVSLTAEQASDSTVILNKQMLIEREPLDYRFLMTRVLYSF